MQKRANVRHSLHNAGASHSTWPWKSRTRRRMHLWLQDDQVGPKNSRG
jgi:hypothetical protein